MDISDWLEDGTPRVLVGTIRERGGEDEGVISDFEGSASNGGEANASSTHGKTREETEESGRPTDDDDGDICGQWGEAERMRPKG